MISIDQLSVPSLELSGLEMAGIILFFTIMATFYVYNKMGAMMNLIVAVVFGVILFKFDFGHIMTVSISIFTAMNGIIVACVVISGIFSSNVPQNDYGMDDLSDVVEDLHVWIKMLGFFILVGFFIVFFAHVL